MWYFEIPQKPPKMLHETATKRHDRDKRWIERHIHRGRDTRNYESLRVAFPKYHETREIQLWIGFYGQTNVATGFVFLRR